jgi:uncharacterized protein YneF (UPF0154 family)
MIIFLIVVAILFGMFGLWYLIKRGWVKNPNKKKQ